MNCTLLQAKTFALTMLILAFATAALPAAAQTPTVLYNFQNNLSDACVPQGSLAQGRDGSLYGVGVDGGFHSCGANGYGAVYKISTTGVENVVFNFPTGWGSCNSGLTLGSDGNFYGACETGNPATGLGSIYKVTPSGVFTDLHDFTATAGDAYPLFAPIQALDGNFYGATGLQNAICGNVYKLTTAGVYTNLHTFSGDCLTASGLTQGKDKNLYGTLLFCSASGNRGCAYKITTKGVYKVFYGFVDATGWTPSSGLIQATDGKFRGTTQLGGTGGNGAIYSLTLAGKITVLHNINVATDGGILSILQPTDGNFYGGGLNGGLGSGSLYELTAKGVFSAFLFPTNGSDGSEPASPLIQHTDGLLYGTTSAGGSHGVGTFFSEDIGAKPFVRLALTSGIESTSVGIFGQGLSNATGVTFGGTTATFTTSGDGYLTATVPSGAKTGSVVVQIPSGNLTSSATFSVTPTIKTFSPTSGPVGTSVTITGTGLLQATKVTFGGVAAAFTPNSDTQVTATVPTGAKTGTIVVTTKGGKATGKGKFTVN